MLFSTVVLFIECLLILALSGGTGHHPLLSFSCYAAAHCFLYAIVFKLFPNSNSPKPGKLRAWLFSSSGIILTGILFRLLFLGYPPSDDLNRYAWEGAMQSKGVNPYVQAPQEFYSEYSNDPVYQGINHKEIPTIYPPLSMMVFRGLSSLFFHVSKSPEAILTGYKLFFIFCDSLTMILLVSLVASWGRPMHWLAIYAWNPLIILYGAGEGHIDILHVFFVIAAVVCFNKKHLNSALGFFMIGCAVMTKYFAIMVLPFILSRRNFGKIFYCFIPFVLFLFYWDIRLVETLSEFTMYMHYNDIISHWFRYFIPERILSIIMFAVFSLGMLWIWVFKQHDIYRSITLGFMWFLLCLSTLHPWYLIIVVPFLIYCPARSWFILLISTGCNFWTYHELQTTGQWHELPWLWFGTYGVFLVMLIWDFYHHHFITHEEYDIPGSIDIVIPILNEGERIDRLMTRLQECIDFLRENWNTTIMKIKPDSSDRYSAVPAVQIKFVDGGSSDRTLQSLELYEYAEVFQLDKPSRGKQFSEGIKRGIGDVVLMLHADAQFRENTLVKLMESFLTYKNLQWGIIGHTYENRPLKMRIIEWSNRLRFSHFGLAFGDQGIFVRRKLLDDIGGIPEIRLMEDVELSLRLNQYPNRINLGGLLVVSTRSWEKKKFSGYTLQVMKLVSSYLFLRRFGADVNQISDEMYDIYYQEE